MYGDNIVRLMCSVLCVRVIVTLDGRNTAELQNTGVYFQNNTHLCMYVFGFIALLNYSLFS